MVQYFYQTAPTKRKFALGIDQEPAFKRRKKKPEVERDSDRSFGEENLHNELESSSDSSDETDSEEEKPEADVEENALVADYLQKVTPGIAREFQV